MVFYRRLTLLLAFLLFVFNNYKIAAQSIPAPTFIEVKEDDRVATLYWNSKTNVYDVEYDPDKQAGVFSYLIEWGKVDEGFTNSQVTPYRVHMLQPLDPGQMYMARIYNLDAFGLKSSPSDTINFQHDATRVDSMRTRLTGFFDDMNYPMGGFSEKDWNQSYSGCMTIGRMSQHINNQFHGHNVLSSGYCDRGIASSRVRHHFDFTDRTGVIEFDLDGSQKGRQFWYLDLTPAERKRDLTGHVSLNSSSPDPADPPHMLRILERGSNVSVHLADENGLLRSLPDRYRNGACGDGLVYCPGENLYPLINVRRHWKIELSKSEIKIFINDILVLDCSLITDDTPNGLGYEVAQVNWLTFSYNTPKENFVMSMVHWDNFGFDAPENYEQTTVVHNYTDNKLGTETPRTGNEYSIGMVSSLETPGISTILIPDSILDINNNVPLSSELMFTIQGGGYSWTPEDSIVINGHSYLFPEPTSSIPSLPFHDLISTNQPYSAILDINPAHLLTGNNEIKFYLGYPRLLNIHIELVYPIDDAPTFTPPQDIYADHISKLMGFLTEANTVGPGIVFSEIDGYRLFEDEFIKVIDPTPTIDRWYVKQTPVSDTLPLVITCNSQAQMAATGKAKGITHYNILLDSVIIETIPTNEECPVAFFHQAIQIDTRLFSNGLHQLFVQAVDVEGNLSCFDAFQAHASPGEYMPIIIDIQNMVSGVDVNAKLDGITLYPNPTAGYFKIVGDLFNYEILILDTQGVILQDLSTTNSEIDIDINDLPSGMYFVRIQDMVHNKMRLEKILKFD